MQKLHRRTGDEPAHPPTQPLLYQVAYCSRASSDVDRAVLQRIVATAQRYNPAHGITGMRVFGSGIFFQWLEGPHEHVVALMQRLRGDPRHDTMVELSQGEEVRERLFPDWSMELVTPDHIRDVLQDALATAEDEKNTESLRLMLEHLDSTGLGQLMGDA